MTEDGRGSGERALDPTQSFTSAETPSHTVTGGSAKAKVSIVTGQRESLSTQERETLRTRLRAATIVILFGFGIYLVRSYLDERPLQAFHTFVVFALTGCIALLVSRTELTTKHLRWLELAIFGLPVVFFVPYHYYCVMQQLAAKDAVGIVAIYKNVASYWFCLLVIYGLFVPNNWKRAAIAVTPMVLLPVLTGMVASVRHEFVGEHLNISELTDTLMVLCVGALCAAYGAEVISSLRQDAREARSFGQYRLLDPIGKGGMGEVYKAEHQLLKRPCAIKLIRAEHAGNPQSLGRFEREVRTTAKLTHWNTIDIYDYGRTDDGTFYYVMEYLPGMNLRQVVDHGGPMPPARVLHVLCQICGALSEAHAEGLIHRDINTGNIFLTQRGRVYDVAKLLDFGLVKVVGTSSDETQLTQLGTVSGTPKYMSPEQASADSRPDACSDIYSLGAVAYVMLTGRVPFDGPSAMDIIIAHARDPVPPMREFNDTIPDGLQQVILKCLEKRPEDRYQSANKLREALEACPLEDTWTQQDAAEWWRDADAAKALEEEQTRSELTKQVDQTMPMDRKLVDGTG